ncbi:MAG: hypothetical protein WCX65_17295 [bacterium]
MNRFCAFIFRLSVFAATALLPAALSVSDCFAKEQPVYVVSNDNDSGLVLSFYGFFPRKPRVFVLEKDAASNKYIYGRGAEKEESSVILVNRSKPDGGVGALKEMFGSDYMNLGPHELLIDYRPKVVPNPNGALLISAPNINALKIGIKAFMKKSGGRTNAALAFRTDIYDCIVYSEFTLKKPNLEDMGFMCDAKYYSALDVYDFIYRMADGHNIFVLNSGNIKNLPDAIKKELPCDTSAVKPNDFMMCAKQEAKKYRVMIVAPNEMVLRNETAGRRLDALSAKPVMATYPDLRGYSSVSVAGLTDNSGRGAEIVDVMKAEIESRLGGYSWLRLTNPESKEAKVKATGTAASGKKESGAENKTCVAGVALTVIGALSDVSGGISYHEERNRLTPYPVFNVYEPRKPECKSEPTKTEECHSDSKKPECKRDEAKEGDCRKKMREYKKELDAYQEAKTRYESDYKYGAYIWQHNVMRDSKLNFRGELRFVDSCGGATVFYESFNAVSSTRRLYNTFDTTVTGAANEPDAASLPKAAAAEDPELLPKAVNMAVANWFSKLENNVILP